MTEQIAERYRRFARAEARGRSPLYERLAMHVAETPVALRFLQRLPQERRQPNLFFAALRLVAGTPASIRDFDRTLEARGDAIARIMLTRTTQTNEPGRCASLLPALAQIEGPLALIEVGASAGLCLLPDAYRYGWGVRRLAAPTCARAPVFCCEASEATPLPARHPEIAWRAGLDLNPLNVADDQDVEWLEQFVWPEHRARLARLRAAIDVARRSPPRVARGDLRQALPDLIAEAPSDATVVVFHTAVLSYVADRSDRARFAQMMVEADVVWLSNEAPHVFPQFAERAGPPFDGMFLLAVNGRPVAWTGPHGQAVRWIGDASVAAQ